MADLGELKAKISAQIEDFEKGVNSAGKKIDEFGKKSEGAGKKGKTGMDKFKASMLALKDPITKAIKSVIAITGALVALSVKTITLTDTQIKLAKALGISNEELAVMKRAGDLAGISVSEMDTNMMMLNKRLGDAINNGGRTAEAFERMGIDLDALAQMNPEEQMLTLGEGLNELSTHAEKASFMTEVFGRSGLKMLNLLNDAEGSFGRARTEVEKYGLALNDTDSKKIEDATDDIGELKTSITGLGREFAVNTAPAMSKITLKLAEWVGGFTQTIRLARIFNDEQSDALLTESDKIKLAKDMEELERKRNEQLKERQQMLEWGEQISADARKEQANYYQEEIDEIQAVLDRNDDRVEQQQKLLDAEIKLKNAIVETKNATAGKEGEGGDTAEDPTAEFSTARLDSLRTSMLNEEELLKENLQNQRDILQEAYENDAIDNQEHNDLMMQIHAQYYEELKELQKKNMTDIQKFQALSWHQQTATVAGELAGLTQTLDSTNKDQFKIIKAGAIAQAIVNTYQGVSKSLSAYPMPLAAVMASAHLAAGLAQVANIKSQSFSGGGSYSAPTAPTSVPAEQAGTSSPTAVTINLTGQTYQRQDVADLISEINDAIGDGARIRTA